MIGNKKCSPHLVIFLYMTWYDHTAFAQHGDWQESCPTLHGYLLSPPLGRDENIEYTHRLL